MVRRTRLFIDQIVEKLFPGGLIIAPRMHGGKVSREGRDVGIIDAGIGRKLIGSQFATLPGTVEWMLQD